MKPAKDRLPTFNTIRRVLIGLGYNQFSKQFYQWAKAYIQIEPWEWLSVDGKASVERLGRKTLIRISSIW
ncbi:MAG: hypothetical protein AAF600_21605 [Bacteroidota bacterium]